MKAHVREGWSYETDDGKVKVSGEGVDVDSVTVELYQPGSGYGMTETPDVRVTVNVSAEEWRALVTAVGRRLSPAKRGER